MPADYYRFYRNLPRQPVQQRERTIERLLSAPLTCRLQRRSLFAYLAQVRSANIRGDPVPAPARARAPECLRN